MIFRRKNRYKLPKFPQTVASTFRALCQALPEEDLPQLRLELDECMNKIYGIADENELIDRELLRKLYECCLHLFDRYSEYSLAQKSLAIGAVRYFVATDDPVPDDGFSTGLDDDVMVMNHVLEQLGEEDMFISLT